VAAKVVRHTAACGMRKQRVEAEVSLICVDRHLLCRPPYVKLVVMYSVTCAGRNENNHVATMCMSFMKNRQSLLTSDH
jgi:proline dehydrogenase